jgi:hypothetical protein
MYSISQLSHPPPAPHRRLLVFSVILALGMLVYVTLVVMKLPGPHDVRCHLVESEKCNSRRGSGGGDQCQDTGHADAASRGSGTAESSADPREVPLLTVAKLKFVDRQAAEKAHAEAQTIDSKPVSAAGNAIAMDGNWEMGAHTPGLPYGGGSGRFHAASRGLTQRSPL